MTDYYTPEELEAMPIGETVEDTFGAIMHRVEGGWACEDCDMEVHEEIEGRVEKLPSRDSHTIEPMPRISRLEVIDEEGRKYVRHDLRIVETMVQDDGRTLKVFVGGRAS